MKKLMKNVRIRHEKGEYELEMNYIPLEKTWVDGKDLLQRFKDGCLAERKHEFLQTQIILNDAGTCRIVVFDMAGEFVTIKSCFERNDAPFSFLVSERYILILPPDSELLKMDIQSIQIGNDQSKN